MSNRLLKRSDGMRTEKYTPELYPMVAEWWAAYGKRAPEADRLSDLGIVICKGETPVAMTWVYLSNSKTAQVGFTVSNPKSGPVEKVIAVSLAIHQAAHVLEAAGYKYVHSFSDEPGLTRIMQSAGFTQLSEHQFLTKEIG